MNQETARDALAIIRTLHRGDFYAVDTVIKEMSTQECVSLAVSLASFAAIWAEMYTENTQGGVERLIAVYMAQLQ
jgi:spore maturation protein SpmA